MILQLRRKWFSPKSTIGELSVDGALECYTLEDTMREIAGMPVASWKIADQTAIPIGTYEVVIDWSKHFGKPMPHVLNVPGYEGIRIHSGNADKDTEGCILLGQTRSADFIGNSHVAFERFLPKLSAALAGGSKVTLLVTNEPVDATKEAQA
jgi:Family of unknown function (DUF5675)